MIQVDKLTKLYYSIGEVAEMFDVSTSLIRYWESEFPTLKPKKDRRGDRKFQKKDIQTLQGIYQLVRVQGFTLEGAKKALKSKELLGDDNKILQIKTKLLGIKKQLKAIREELKDE